MTFEEFRTAMLRCAQTGKVDWRWSVPDGQILGQYEGLWLHPVTLVATLGRPAVPNCVDECAGLLGMDDETLERVEAAVRGECEKDLERLVITLSDRPVANIRPI